MEEKFILTAFDMAFFHIYYICLILMYTIEMRVNADHVYSALVIMFLVGLNPKTLLF